ncbi:dihydroorotate dehydrogenase-like protein [Fibrobacterota bacterium]
MADLSTEYMGLKLAHPIVPGASPLTKTIDGIKELEDAGAPAMVLYSIFEEQLRAESSRLDHFLNYGSETFAEAVNYFPNLDLYNLGPEEYLEHIRRAKEAVAIPVIASLNGVSLEGWTDYAKSMQQAGADGLELNMYYLAAHQDIDGYTVEERYLKVIKAVKGSVTIPVAMKLSPFFSSVSHMSNQLSRAGADALVLFNRFYQPEININELSVEPHLVLSNSNEKNLPLRWIAILHGRIFADIAASTGIHSVDDVIAMVMAGANITQVTSVLLDKNLNWISSSIRELGNWLEKRGYNSLEEITGLLSQQKCAEPAAYERANYVKTLMSFS